MSRSATSGQRRLSGSPLACTLGHAATFVVNALLHWWWVRSTKTHEPFLFAPSYQRRAWGSTNSKHRYSRNRYDPNGHQGLRQGVQEVHHTRDWWVLGPRRIKPRTLSFPVIKPKTDGRFLQLQRWKMEAMTSVLSKILTKVKLPKT